MMLACQNDPMLARPCNNQAYKGHRMVLCDAATPPPSKTSFVLAILGHLSMSVEAHTLDHVNDQRLVSMLCYFFK